MWLTDLIYNIYHFRITSHVVEKVQCICCKDCSCLQDIMFLIVHHEFNIIEVFIFHLQKSKKRKRDDNKKLNIIIHGYSKFDGSA